MARPRHVLERGAPGLWAVERGLGHGARPAAGLALELHPVTLVGRDELAAVGARNAGDALARIAGVQMDGPHNQRERNQEARVRGFEPQYTLGLVDGERTVSRELRGATDFASIAADAIERIEVVRGPMAVLYGGDAIAGVINVRTRPDVPRDAALFRLAAGHFGALHAGAMGAARFGSHSVRAQLSHDRAEGWTDDHDLDRSTDESGSGSRRPRANRDRSGGSK